MPCVPTGFASKFVLISENPMPKTFFSLKVAYIKTISLTLPLDKFISHLTETIIYFEISTQILYQKKSAAAEL